MLTTTETVLLWLVIVAVAVGSVYVAIKVHPIALLITAAVIILGLA